MTPTPEIDHVQLAMPSGGEAAARAFYGALLGLAEAPKPPALRARGGVWFATGNLQLHLGVDATFQPGAKAHVALRVDSHALPALLARLEAAGHSVEGADDLAGYPRCYVRDPFGNRIELLKR
jgi:catechol 2,3-dioxygenase-like lactoylglutathione lyase family enzyme